MNTLSKKILATLSGCTLAVLSSTAFAKQDCEDLVGLSFTIKGTMPVEITDAVPDTVDPNQAHTAIPHCLVSGTVDSDPNDPSSIIQFRMRLPDDWNKRLWVAGDGGLAGNVADEGYLSLYGNPDVTALLRGFATLTSDTGHTGGLSADWGLDNPPSPGIDNEAEINYSDRGVHLSTVAGKKLLKKYYHQRPKYSYYSGCSNAGRQGLKSAVLYPNDYDGVIATAPAARGTILRLSEYARINSNLAEPLTESKMEVISQAALDKCDGLDGVLDGILNNPLDCEFDATLDVTPCPGNVDAPNCLTIEQAQAVNRFYQDTQVEHPNYTSRGLVPSSETGNAAASNFGSGWNGWFLDDGFVALISPYDSLGELFVTEFARYFMYDDPTLDLVDYWNNVDLQMYNEDLNIIIRFFEERFKFKRFVKKDHKLLLFQGWLDPAVAPGDTIDYYKAIRSKNGKDFVRLYMMPGVGHCRGGAGAQHFDFIDAIQDWVEKGKAPRKIIAANVEGTFTRKLCPFPKEAVYIGGDPNDQRSFRCKKVKDRDDDDSSSGSDSKSSDSHSGGHY